MKILILALVLLGSSGCASTNKMVEVPHPYVEATHERDRAEIHAQDGRIIRGAIHGFYPESIAIKDDVSGTVLQLPNDEVMSKQSLVWQKCNVMLDQSFRRWLLLPSFIVPGLGQVLYEDSISVSGGTHAVIHLGLIGGMVNANTFSFPSGRPGMPWEHSQALSGTHVPTECYSSGWGG